MYSTARRVDALGRIVLPAELRRSLGISEGDPLDVSEADGSIVLTRHADSCAICRSETELIEFRGRHICSSCVSEIRTKARASR